MADVTLKILTPAENFNLMTLDELKVALGITSTTQATDAQWNWLIEFNSVAIAGLINRTLAKEELIETWRDVQNRQRIYLSHFPAKASDIQSVTTQGNVRLDYEFEEESGKLSVFSGYAEDVVVHYTGGYDLPDDAPMDLKQCCVLLAATWKAQLAMVQVTGVRMIAHKEARVMFHTPTTGGGIGVHGAGVPPAVEAILTGYTRFWVDAVIEIKVDDAAILKQFDELQKNVTGLQTETSVTFFNWQVEDMHRHFPEVDGSGLSLSTDIHQHSQLNREAAAWAQEAASHRVIHTTDRRSAQADPAAGAVRQAQGPHDRDGEGGLHMAVDFSTLVYMPNFDMFARPITVIPLASQPGVPAYGNRGIYDTRPIDVQAQDGSIFSDQQTICDVRDAEFIVVPTQLDQIEIPDDPGGGVPGLGTFEVTHTEANGGGETTLVLRKLLVSKPS